jgi:ligand-binding sensor domain-containing protein
MKKILLLATLFFAFLLLCGASSAAIYSQWPQYEERLAALAEQLGWATPSPQTIIAASHSSHPRTTAFPTPQIITPHWQTHSDSSLVQAIALDPETGWAWLGTAGGLLVLDPATNQQTYFFPEHGLPANNITAVDIAPNTAVWVATADGGVGQYHQGYWTRYTISHGLPSDAIRDLHISPNGDIWVATSQGVAQLPAGAITWEAIPTPFAAVTSLTAVAGGLWIGTANDGIHYRDHLSGTWHSQRMADGLPADQINALALAPNGELWVATPAGLGQFDGFRWHTITEEDGLLDHNIATLGLDGSGGIWVGFGTAARGAQRLQPLPHGGWQMTLYQRADGLPSDVVTAVSSTPDGQLWLGTANGIAHTSQEPSQWQTIPTRHPAQPPAPPIHALQAIGDTLWVGTGQGVSRWQDGQWTHFSSADGLPEGEAVALAVDDATGTLWVAHRTPAQGLSRWLAETERWETRPCLATPSSPRIFASLTHSLHLTDSDGAGWLGGHDALFRLEPSPTADGFICRAATELTGQTINSIIPDPTASPDGVLLATPQQIWQASPRQLAPWSAPLPQAATPLRQLAIGPDGVVWLLGGHMVARWLGMGTGWEEIPLAELFTGEVRGLAHGRDLTLYLATNRGVLRYTNGQWHTLTTATGLPSNDVRLLQPLPDGSLWLATPAGLTQFTP